MSETNKNNNETFLKRLSNALAYTLNGKTPGGWFGPQEPLKPIAQEAEGRQYDYPFAVNLTNQAKKTEGGVNFNDLRLLADNCDILRIVIETRKDQMSRLKFKFQLKDATKEKHTDERCEELEKFFESPDKRNNWDDWIRALLEDLFVIDAPCVYPVLTYSNRPYAFELMDGSTIKRVLDYQGRTPNDGVSVAYQQELKGLPAVNYTCNELIYRPRNIRTNKIYGFSPVEQIVNTINVQLRKMTTQMTYYSEGNMPNILVGMPKDWSTDQIVKFQNFWNSVNTGTNKNTAKFVPDGLTLHNLKPMDEKNEFDEWLARVICFCFSISPQALSPQMNRATAQTAKQSSDEEGLYPVMEWLRNFINDIIFKYFGYDDIEFVWDIEEDLDPTIQADIHTKYLSAGVLKINEVRKSLGLEPLPDEELNPPQPVIEQQSNENEEGVPFNQKMFKSKKKILNINKKDISENETVIKEEKILSETLFEYFRLQKESILKQIQSKFFSKINKSDIEEEEDEDDEEDFEDVEFDEFFDDLDFDLEEEKEKEVSEKIKSSLLIIGAVSIAYSLTALYNRDKKAKERSEKDLNLYASERSAELIGKKIDEDGNLTSDKSEYSLNETTKESLKSIVKESLKNNENEEQVSEKIKESYSFSEKRSEMIARTEKSIADNEVSMKTFRNAGVEKKTWQTMDDDRVSDECMQNQSQGAIDIDDSFSSGDDCPPCHPNCRCVIVAVVNE